MIKAKKFTHAGDIHDERGFVWGVALKCSQGYCWTKGEEVYKPDPASGLYTSLKDLEAGLFVDAGFGHNVNGKFTARLKVSK